MSLAKLWLLWLLLLLLWLFGVIIFELRVVSAWSSFFLSAACCTVADAASVCVEHLCVEWKRDVWSIQRE